MLCPSFMRHRQRRFGSLCTSVLHCSHFYLLIYIHDLRPIPYSMGVGLLYAATVFPVLAPLPPALAGQALAFLVFVRNFGNILGITIGESLLGHYSSYSCNPLRDARLCDTHKRAQEASSHSIPGAVFRRRRRGI